jgi:nuclear cap-binding protein subunit 2
LQPNPITKLCSIISNYLSRFYLRNDSENAIRFVNGTRLDDRIVRTDWDAGFIEGRQYGRGKTGGQVSISSAQTY